MSEPLPRVLLLWGKDRGKIQARLEAIREQVLRPGGVSNGMEVFNHEVFDGPYLEEVKVVIGACRQMPMSSAERLVELSSPEGWASQKGALDTKQKGKLRDLAVGALIDYMVDPSPSTVLVITSEGLTKTSKLVKAAMAANGARQEKFEPPSADTAAQELRELAAAEAVAMDGDAVRLLVERVGVGRAELRTAFEHARSHGDGQRITVEDVDAVAADHREFDVFRIVDAVGRGDQEEALEELARAFPGTAADYGNAMRIFPMLLRQLRVTFAAHAGGQRAAAAYGMPGHAARKTVQNARRFDEARLRRAYASLAHIDASFKGAAAGRKIAQRDPALLLQRWILETCDALPGAAHD